MIVISDNSCWLLLENMKAYFEHKLILKGLYRMLDKYLNNDRMHKYTIDSM